MDTSGSSEEDSLKRTSKKGHTSLKKVQEEESKHLNMQGSQATIDIPITKNTRARPSKGGPFPSINNK